ncbi:MAG TPA: hypothetical protein VMV36_01265 [Ignavibacteriaceae bacterium]|nr:hypothetical protein [Ignavibacteriaceae bacterium]
MTESDKNIFKYNLSFYYQSTIIYFIVFILYVIIRGEFVEDSFIFIVKDPIIYFFAFIVIFSLIGLLYNVYRKRFLEITNEQISFIEKSRLKTFKTEDIIQIKISKRRERFNNKVFRLIRLKIKNRRRPIIIRPSDYENEEVLIKKFQMLKEKPRKL